MNSIDKLLEIEKKIKRLTALYSALQIKNNELSNKLLELETRDRQQKEKIESLCERLEIVRMARVLSGGEEKTLDIKQKINDFAKEIDKCIGLLSAKL